MTDPHVKPVPAADILARILARKAEEVTARRASVAMAEMGARAAEAPPARGFAAALDRRIAAGKAAVIAECKRASPSRGVIRSSYDPAAIGHSYAAGGAACLSVLTDTEFFGGADDHLRAARQASGLPVLRKDFMIDPYQIHESRALGADCVLLIVAALDDGRLRDLGSLARELGMDVLIEVHDREELDRALGAGPGLLGINNRDLRTFETRLETTLDLLDAVPPGTEVVTESGIHTRGDIARMRAAGVHAFLVGEAFMRAPDPGKQLAALFDDEQET